MFIPMLSSRTKCVNDGTRVKHSGRTVFLFRGSIVRQDWSAVCQVMRCVKKEEMHGDDLEMERDGMDIFCI